jgi:nicotinamidase-related amidase
MEDSMLVANSTIAAGSILAIAIAAVALGTRTTRADPTPTTLRALYGLKPPVLLRAPHTALILVDFQDEFVRGRLPLPDVRTAIEHAAELAGWARRSNVLVLFVKNVVSRRDSPLFAASSATSAFVPQLKPRAGDYVLEKSIAGAFSRTPLDSELRARGIDTLIVAGLMTHLAVLITASDAAVLGYRVIVAADATATRALPGAGGADGVDEKVLQRAALAMMADRVADVMPAREIMALPLPRVNQCE